MKKDIKTEEKLTALLCDEPFFSAVYCYECVTSTNDLAKDLAKNGAGQGTVVISKSQSQGRGRMGRCFHSPSETGLYMSLILRPGEYQQNAGLLTACGAVAVWQAILDATGKPVDIKWVNDLYADGKKLCGILAEGHCNATGILDYVILGIGINLLPPEGGYAEDIADIATSIFEVSGKKVDRASLCANVLRHWFSYYSKLPKVDFLELYRTHSCVLGKTVSYIKNGETHSGVAVSIDDAARLVVKQSDGTVDSLETGEISLLRPVL